MHYIMKNTPCGVYKSSWLRKSLNIMRCVILFILLGTLQSFANLSYSQSVKLSLNMEDRKSTRLNSSHTDSSRMPSSA